MAIIRKSTISKETKTNSFLEIYLCNYQPGKFLVAIEEFLPPKNYFLCENWRASSSASERNISSSFQHSFPKRSSIENRQKGGIRTTGTLDIDICCVPVASKKTIGDNFRILLRLRKPCDPHSSSTPLHKLSGSVLLRTEIQEGVMQLVLAEISP